MPQDIDSSFLDLPDTQGAAPAPSEPPPADNLPDTMGADQALPQPTQTPPKVDPIPAPPTDPGRGPIIPVPGEDPRPATPPTAVPQAAAPNPATITSHRAKRIDRDVPQVARLIEEEAASAGMDPGLLKTLVDIESSGNPNAQDSGSSYKGLLQMSDSEMARFGGGASAFDARANLRAGIASIRHKASVFKKAFGREPTVTELYLGHQQGEGGLAEHLRHPGRAAWESMYATGEGRQKGAAWARKAIWGNIPSDMKHLFPGGVDTVTSAQFMAVWAQKVQGIPYEQALATAQGGTAGAGSVYGATDFTRTIPRGETVPPFVPAGSAADDAILKERVTYNPPPSLWKTAEAAADETTTAYVFRDSPVFAPDPSYKPSVEELELRKQGLPEKFHDRLIGISHAHSDYLTEQARRQAENEQTLAAAGWTGTGIGLVTSMADPVDLSVAIASGGLGAFAGGAFKAGRLGQRLFAAGSAAAGNMALTGLSDEAGRVTEASDYAYAAAWGAGLGFAFGPLARNPATQDLADAGAHAANRAKAGIEKAAMGEAGDLGAAMNPDSTLQFSHGDLTKLGERDVSRTAVESLRPDMAGRIGSSKNPSARALGEALGTDVVGRKDADGNFVVNPFSAGEDKARFMSEANHQLYSVARPQFEEWAKDRGVSWWHFKLAPRMSKAWHDFADEVTAYTRDTRADRDARYDPQVVKVAKEMNAIFEAHRKGNVSPRSETPDNPGRPLPGWESVPPNRNYLPRVWHLGKILAHGANGRKFREWLEGALLASNKALGDKAAVIADGMWAGINRRAFNVDEFFMMSRDGATADTLRAGMLELGLKEADIDEVLARLPKGSKPSFTHFRLDLDEGFVSKSGLKLSDFTETNAFDLFDHYNHQASAWRAAGRIQIVDGKGDVVLDGIRSRQEVNNALRQVAARGHEAGQAPKEIADDAALLREEFDRLFGIPHDSARTNAAMGAEIVRNLGTMTMGGNFGLSALPDMARVATIGGLRAMIQHMPSFRDILDGGVLRPKSELGRDIVAGFGAVDEWRGISPRRLPEDGALTMPMEGVLGKMASNTKVASDFVVAASGMPLFNRFVRTTSRKVMADRFYRDAEKAFTGMEKVTTRRPGPAKDFSKELGDLRKELAELEGLRLKVAERADAAAKENAGDLWGRVVREAYRLGGGNFSTRVRLKDLRDALPDVDRKELDALLRKKAGDQTMSLFHLDDPRDRGPADEAASIDLGGRPAHILYMSPENRGSLGGPKATGQELHGDVEEKIVRTKQAISDLEAKAAEPPPMVEEVAHTSRFDLSKLSETELNRLKWFGLDGDMLTRVLSQVWEHAEVVDSVWGAKLSRLRPEQWTDLEAKNAFGMALNRAAARASMEHDFGAGTVFDRSPVFRSLTQLRRFALNAWHMNILHGYAMRDPEVFFDVLASSLAAASLYVVRTRIQAATADDPERFLREHMTPTAIAAATFQLSAYSSLAPALVDTGVGLIGADPVFGYRNSSLPSDVLFGNPSVAALDKLLKTTPSAILQPIIEGRERSQQEWRFIAAVLPFANNIAVQSALGGMVQDAPRRPPKTSGYSVSDLIMGKTD